MPLDPATTDFLPAAPGVVVSVDVVVDAHRGAIEPNASFAPSRFAKAGSDVRVSRVDLSASTRRQRIDEWGGVRLLEETESDE